MNFASRWTGAARCRRFEWKSNPWTPTKEAQSPIALAYSTDGGATFSDPQLISGNVLYGQGSRPVVGPDGTVYVFWDGSMRLSTFDSIWMVKSSDGGVTWSKPVEVAPLADITPPANTAFRVNSYPAAAVATDGTLYTAWSSQMKDSATSYSTAAASTWTPMMNCAPARSRSCR